MKRKVAARKTSAETRRPRRAATVKAAAAQVEIRPAKGRPMLTWVGKRPLSRLAAFPAQHIETFDPKGVLGKKLARAGLWAGWPDTYPKGGLLFHGDNKEVLAALLATGFRGKVNLIYMDPPFDSGADYVRQVSLRGPTSGLKVEGEGYGLGEQMQYADIWANDTYLQFMFERLLLMRELLADDGSLYLHCDWHRGHHLRCLLDEAFGPDGVIAEVVWQRSDSHNDATHFGIVHDTLLVYSKSDKPKFNRIFLPLSQRTADNWYRHVEDRTGRRYNLGNLVSPHPRPNLMYEWKGIAPPGMGWRVSKERMEELDRRGLLVVVGKGGRRTLKVKQYLDESKGRLLSTWWDDISQLRGYSADDEKTEYPTQKPEELLERILKVSSEPGDIVLDCYIGSGTTAAVAQKLARRWIGCDINKGAVQTTARRLQCVIEEQIAAAASAAVKPKLPSLETEEYAGPTPAQLGFTVWRVNDYDLQIQHNEAVELVCEHVGVERTRSDRFFDGRLGESLIKIVPFNHPLSPLDLEELRNELAARPDEDRKVAFICLGAELAAQAWVEEWNRLRKGKNAVNRIEVIELRTDPRYGRFIRHELARARVKVARKKDKLFVVIEDFISPSILERLEQQAGLLKPKIDDWRAMVDCVMIDPSYDGKVFNVALSDIPEKKADLVVGHYELPAPKGEATVAVKVIDMLGEEVVTTKRI